MGVRVYSILLIEKFYRKRGAMDARRDEHVRRLIADAIVDAVDRLYDNDQITNKERYQWYRHLAGVPGLVKELMPANYQDALKQEIKWRLEDSTLWKEMPFPDKGNPYVLSYVNGKAK